MLGRKKFPADTGKFSAPAADILPLSLNVPEHKLVSTSFKRFLAALALILPVAAMATSPVMAATHHKAKHGVSVHKTSAHRHHKATVSTTSS